MPLTETSLERHPCDISLSIVMPAFNEGNYIRACMERVLRENCVKELIVVDDGSSDTTAEAVEDLIRTEPRIRLAKHKYNQGKGAALRTGFALAQGNAVLVQDADLECDPEDYMKLLRPIQQGRADVVFGSRFLGGGAHRVLYFWHYLGDKLLTLCSNCFTGLNLSDMESGMKLFRREVLTRIHLQENRFGVEPEVVAKVAALNVRVYEVPISYYGRTYAEGKKVGWRDGVSALRCILKYGLRRSRP
jgi:glycosyltransferase involved in cell wall biosynthesis